MERSESNRFVAPKVIWADVVRTALRERGLSANAAAAQLGVSGATLSAWLTGRTEPSVDDLSGLAQLADLPASYLLSLANRIPAPLASSSRLLLIESAVKGALRDLDRWTNAAQNLVALPGAAYLAGAILDRCEGWTPTLVPRYRGRRHRVRAQTFVLLRSDSGIEIGEQNRAALQRDIEAAIGPTMDIVGAVWRDDHQLDRPRDTSELVLMVLDQERSKGPRETVSGDARSVAVLGLPYAHAELAASVIAEELDFGLVNPLDLAQRRFGLTRSNDESRRGQIRIVDEILSGVTDSMRHVWTTAEPRVLESIDLRRIRSDCIIILCGPLLQAEGRRMWGLAEEQSSRMEAQLKEFASCNPEVATLYISDGDIFSEGELDRDELFDIAWELGLQAARSLPA